MDRLIKNLVGKRITGIRPLNPVELIYEGEEATDGILIDLGSSGCIVICNKTMDCDEFPDDTCWTEVSLRTGDGTRVNLITGEAVAH
jgi:hypothetical protein